MRIVLALGCMAALGGFLGAEAQAATPPLRRAFAGG